MEKHLPKFALLRLGKGHEARRLVGVAAIQAPNLVAEVASEIVHQCDGRRVPEKSSDALATRARCVRHQTRLRYQPCISTSIERNTRAADGWPVLTLRDEPPRRTRWTAEEMDRGRGENVREVYDVETTTLRTPSAC
jgi:hypothetical protein